MRMYVDELPKDCWDCPMHDGENGQCKMLVCYTDYIPKNCPLQSLTDYTKQVRKEVCEKIRIDPMKKRENIDRLVENVENLCSNDLKPMWDKWHEEMTKQIKETIKGE